MSSTPQPLCYEPIAAPLILLKESDELIVVDIDATVKNKEPDYKQIQRMAAECRMPLCYGGGIKTAEQAKKIISLGVEKVAISSAAIERPELISEVAEAIGSQSVVVVLDVKKRFLSKAYDVWTHNGTKNTKEAKANKRLFLSLFRVSPAGS